MLPLNPLLGSAQLGGGQASGGLEKGGLGAAEVWPGPLAPLEYLGQARPPVELGVRSAHCVPRVGGRCKVTQEPLASEVVVEPLPKPRPHPDERLVGDLHRIPVDADQAGVYQLLHQATMFLVDRHLVPRHPGPDRGAGFGGHDETQQQAAELGALDVIHGAVQQLRRLGHSVLDPPGRLVALEGQGRALAAPRSRAGRGRA